MLTRIRDNIAKVMVGKEEVITLLLAAFAAGGHVLLEDVPGTGKTVLAKSTAKSMDLSFGRIQFTPDLLPSDVTGLNYFDQSKGQFVFREGPVFTNILLADEINRATPRTQSALLECMGEGQVTVDGVTRTLAEPFFVIATQNPVETLGCFPLPEAQLDRFLMKLNMGALSVEEELRMVDRFISEEPLAALKAVTSKEDVLALREKCTKIRVHEDLRRYIVSIAQASRALGADGSSQGVSPRGTLALLRASQGYALVKGREFVVPEDIKAVAVSVLAHRLLMEEGSSARRQDRIRGLLDTVPVPTEDWGKGL